MIVEVGEETPLGLVVGVGDVVAGHRPFSGDLTYPRHGLKSLN
jgi:hypothetical protein